MSIEFKAMLAGLVAVSFLVFSPALQARPILKSDVSVTSAIVTVGDMFENAGMFSESALFRSPAPGTTGQVSVQNISLAANRIGLEDFENPGLLSVSVYRAGTLVDERALEELITRNLLESGTLRQGMEISMFLDTPFTPTYAEGVSEPATLNSLRYVPGSNRFSARFKLAGLDRMIDVSGRLDFTIQAPHLVRSLPAGSILGATDMEMRPVPMQFANGTGIPMMEQLLGKQLQRNLLGGAALRLSDVVEPNLISRNEIVTLFLKSGPMTLTVKGRALDDAARGQTVSVLNLLSNTVVQGTAIKAGTVEISTNSKLVASL